MARPTDYLPEYNEQGYRLALLGLKDSEMAEFFQIAESTYYEWLNKFPEFSESIKNGKLDADGKVAMALYKKATGQITVTEETESEKGLYVTTKQLPPDTTAAIFWLKNRQGNNWRDVAKHEHTGKEGSPLVITLESDSTNQETE